MLYKIETDGPYEGYEMIDNHIKSLKNVEGFSCEIGLRRGGGSLQIMNSFINNQDPRIHIAIDPYGAIPYKNIFGTSIPDYTNEMRNQTLSLIYQEVVKNKNTFIFFNIEDSEFFVRFESGVPIYQDSKKIIYNKYAFVHIDGQHDLESVRMSAEFFNHRTSIGGLLAFDNVYDYDHNVIHNYLLDNGFEFLSESSSKKVYRKNEDSLHSQ